MAKTTALIVDDEPDLVQLVAIALKQMDVEALGAYTLSEAKNKLESYVFNFCLTDMQLPDGSGVQLIEFIQEHYPNIPVAVITAFGNMNTAVECLKAGAFDYVAKPLDISILRKMVHQATTLNFSMTDPKSKIFIERDSLLDQRLIGKSALILKLKQQIIKVAQSQAPIFIQGESGTGKEVVARCIHELSPRGQGPFIAVNCGAIPSELIESELFGHKKGSFSGAVKDKMGLFEAAEGGTLFLDEVADLPLQMQVKLLRVIQEKKVRPVGETLEKPIDCRLLSATHKDLEGLVKTNHFRDDLFYRINVIQILTPPLRNRQEDIPLLAEHILQLLCKETGQRFTFNRDSQELLLKHPFPGNVRELQNAIQRACTLCENLVIQPVHLQLETSSNDNIASTHKFNESYDQEIDVDVLSNESKSQQPIPELEPFNPIISGALEDYLAKVEVAAILKTLEMTHWNKTAAAKVLGLSCRSLRYRLKKLGIDD